MTLQELRAFALQSERAVEMAAQLTGHIEPCIFVDDAKGPPYMARLDSPVLSNEATRAVYLAAVSHTVTASKAIAYVLAVPSNGVVEVGPSPDLTIDQVRKMSLSEVARAVGQAVSQRLTIIAQTREHSILISRAYEPGLPPLWGKRLQYDSSEGIILEGNLVLFKPANAVQV